MRPLSKTRTPILCLALLLILVAGPGHHAQAWPVEEWVQWNAVSPSHYPGETWTRYATPEEAGWDSEGLANAQKLSEAFGSAAVMVVYDGVVLAEWGQVDRRYMCHSMRKSLLSALYGIAVDRGQIDIEEMLEEIGIEDDSPLTETERTAKISDLLKSRSGVYLPAAYETPAMKKARPARGSHAPGTHWYYNNWDFNVLATIYNQETGGDLFRAFKEDIADPLQMQDFEMRHTYYHLEAENSRHPAYPFRMSARDLARFGLLFLNDGRWRDKQIISSAWVRESTASYSKARNGGYGYMWWTAGGRLGELGAYAAAGYGGQWVYVIPGARLVVVHRADTYQDKHVEFTSVWTILATILNARTGPPLAKPRFVEMEPPPPVDPGPTLSDSQLAPLTGSYRQEDNLARIQTTPDGLELESPTWGRYALIPRSATEFLVEDVELPLEFVLDASGGAMAIRIWFEADEPYDMPRVP